MAGDQPHRRRKQWFLRLFEAGHVSARWISRPVTGADILYLPDEDIAAFHSRFMTPVTMQAEFGLHWRTCIARLNAAKVSPFAPEGQDFGAVYERQQVEAVLRSDTP